MAKKESNYELRLAREKQRLGLPLNLKEVNAIRKSIGYSLLSKKRFKKLEKI